MSAKTIKLFEVHIGRVAPASPAKQLRAQAAKLQKRSQSLLNASHQLLAQARELDEIADGLEGKTEAE